MKELFLTAILLLVMASSCRAFGQPVPKMVVNGEVIDFDPSRILPAGPGLRSRVLGSLRKQISDAQALKIHRIGTVDIDGLAKSLDSVNVVLVESPALVVGDGEFSARTGAVYVVEKKTVYVNVSSYAEDPLRVEGLFPHEVLGALGVDDRDYQFSTLLKNAPNAVPVIDKINKVNRRFPGHLQSSPTKTFDRINGRSGGVTVVGGGGDGVMAEFKALLFAKRASYKAAFLEAMTPENMRAMSNQIHLPKNFSSKLKDGDFNSFDAVLLRTPIEAMTPTEVASIERPLKSSDFLDIANIVSVRRVSESDLHAKKIVSGYFIRLSREHWKTPMTGQSLAASQSLTAFWAYATLFIEWTASEKLGCQHCLGDEESLSE